MGWHRNQHDKQEYKRPRHTRTPLCIEKCSDCGKTLQATFAVVRFLGRCRSCFDLSSQAAVMSWSDSEEIASH